MLLASPKSVTLMLNLWSTMTLEGLRSRWMICLSVCRQRRTDRRQISSFQITSSSKKVAFSFWLRMSSARLQPLMTSITMQRYPSSTKDSQNLTILGCFNSLQILTSRERSSSPTLSPDSWIFIRFSAYQFDPFLARNTLPNAPCPSSSSRLQLPTTCSLQFLFPNSLASFSYSSSMFKTLELSILLKTSRAGRQALRGLTKWPTSRKGMRNQLGKICLKILRFLSSEPTYLSSLKMSSLNSSKASGSSESSTSSNLMMWELVGWDLTRRMIASSMPSSMYLELMSLSRVRWVMIFMFRIISLKFMGSLILRLTKEVKLFSLKSQTASVLVVSSSRQIQFSREIFSNILELWHLLSSLIRVGTPLIRLKFSLKCLQSSRSLIKFTNFGLLLDSTRSSANKSRPTYQTSSSTWLMPCPASSFVISIMILVSSELLSTSRSRMALNMSSWISWGSISMQRRWRASISISMTGCEVISGSRPLMRMRNWGERLPRISGGLVSMRRSCRAFKWLGPVMGSSWRRATILRASALGGGWARNLAMQASRYLISSLVEKQPPFFLSSCSSWCSNSPALSIQIIYYPSIIIYLVPPASSAPACSSLLPPASSLVLLLLLLQLLLQVLLVVVDVAPGAHAQLHAAVWADLLDRRQELELFLLGGGAVEDLLGLGQLIGRRELFVEVDRAADFPQRGPRVFHNFRIRIQTLNDVLDLRESHVLLPIFVGPLLRHEWLHRLHHVLPQLLVVLLVVVRRPLLVQRQRVRQVHRVRVVELGVLVHSRLLVHSLQRALHAQIRIEEHPGFPRRCSNHYLVDGFAPDHIRHRCFTHVNRLQLGECLRIEEVQVALLLLGLSIHRGASQQVLPVWAQAHFAAWKPVRQVAVVHNRVLKVPCVPYLQGPVPVASRDLPASFHRDQRRIFILGPVGVPDAHLWSMEVVLRAEALERAVQAAAEDHCGILSIGDASDASHEALLILALYQLLVPQLLFNALQFLVHIPQANAAVSRASREFVCIDGVEFPVVDRHSVPLRVVQLLDVHVALHCQQVSRPILVQERHLLAPVHHHQVRVGVVEADCPDRIPRKRLHYPEAVHVAVHPMEVPQPNVVVKASSCHSDAFRVHRHTRHRPRVAFQGGIIVHGDAQLVETFIHSIRYLLHIAGLASLHIAGLVRLLIRTALDVVILAWSNHGFLLQNRAGAEHYKQLMNSEVTSPSKLKSTQSILTSMYEKVLSCAHEASSVSSAELHNAAISSDKQKLTASLKREREKIDRKVSKLHVQKESYLSCRMDLEPPQAQQICNLTSHFDLERRLQRAEKDSALVHSYQQEVEYLKKMVYLQSEEIEKLRRAIRADPCITHSTLESNQREGKKKSGATRKSSAKVEAKGKKG